MIKQYYQITKPGILFGNAVTAAGGYALAAKGSFSFISFFTTLLGLSFVVASACVCNNYKDRYADAKMTRTKNRALAVGAISPKQAIAFATLLILCGIFVLGFYTNLLTLFAALTGFVIYVFLYTRWKYDSIHGTLIGSIAGAVPPVVGYCSLYNQFDLGAVLLFSIVALWQMPHFFAIAIYRMQDYRSASIPVLPVKKGIALTKVHMLAYIAAFILATSLLTFLGYTGYIYFTIMTGLGFVWIWLSIQGFKSANDVLWARKMFIFSLIIILALSLMIFIDAK